ncbi:MAG: methyl-accepting chemotaxis protein [Archangium sp.]
MSEVRAPLHGRHRWVTMPSTIAVLVGLLLAVLYAWVAIDFPEGTRLSLAVVLGVLVIAINFIGDGIEQRRLMPLRLIAEGTLAPTRPNLLGAARAVYSIGELSFWLCCGFVALGAVVTALLWGFIADVPLPVMARLCFIGLAIGPITATLALLFTQRRSRALLQEIVAAGLPSIELHAGLPASFVLRQRLIVFAAIATTTPLLLLVDLALSRLRRLVDVLIFAPDAAQFDSLAAQQRADGIVPALALVVLVLIVVSISAWLSGASLGKPLKQLALETERLARGQHGEPPFVPAEYEALAASGALASIEAQLLSLLTPLGRAASSLGSTHSALAPRPTVQKHALDAANGTTLELARNAKEIASTAQSVSEFARHTLDAAKAGQTSADGFLRAMGEVRRGNQAIADSVVRLNKRVQQVGRIVEFIDGIADKSDLLALNAELEGNKAGEVGRGFSLVAAEMRRLAESVMVSTREIARLIEEIRDATNAAVMATEAGVKATDAGAALAQSVGAGLQKIVGFANQSADAMASISLATGQQQLGTDQLVGAMSEILRSAEASNAASTQMSSAHEHLIALARDLQGTIGTYELRSSDSGERGQS